MQHGLCSIHDNPSQFFSSRYEVKLSNFHILKESEFWILCLLLPEITQTELFHAIQIGLSQQINC